MDVSSWPITGYGENSTLEKFELISPDNIPYVIKFAREFENDRTNWEDLNEVIASIIAKMLGLEAVDAQMVYHKGRRACLMKHFGFQKNADSRETIASLLESSAGESYNNIWQSSLPNQERFSHLIGFFENFKYYSLLKSYYVNMNLYDALIGNQDRHGHNWQLLYRGGQVFPSPLYDNGASLGWQLNDDKLLELINDEEKMGRFFSKTLTKVGLDNKETPKIKIVTLIHYFSKHYPEEVCEFKNKLIAFDLSAFRCYCDNLPYISETRKKFLVEFIAYRRKKLLELMELR